MSRGAGLCGKCGGPQRGRSARVAMPIGDCARCNTPVCEKHSEWNSELEALVCKTNCPRRARGGRR